MIRLLLACCVLLFPAAASSQRLPEPSAEAARVALEACLAENHAGRGEECMFAYSRPCQRDRDFSTYTMARCGSAEIGAWAQLLQEFYDELLLIAPEWETPHQEAAHAAWLAWREAECRWAESENEGGTMAVLNAVGCENRLTGERALVYWRHLKDERPKAAARARLLEDQ